MKGQWVMDRYCRNRFFPSTVLFNSPWRGEDSSVETPIPPILTHPMNRKLSSPYPNKRIPLKSMNDPVACRGVIHFRIAGLKRQPSFTSPPHRCVLGVLLSFTGGGSFNPHIQNTPQKQTTQNETITD